MAVEQRRRNLTGRYLLLWWRRGIIQLIKILRLGGEALRFWLGAAAMDRWFGEKAREKVLREVRDVAGRIEVEAADSAAINDHRCGCSRSSSSTSGLAPRRARSASS